jgi:2-C-methyl-D-erythritol 2,4-cyclodiphosphate synthase
MKMRIGQGMDVHRFGPGDHLMLGGVRIPFDKGFVAHSDGDVLLHALCDALLGSLALGDIGRHFPDTDPEWCGADSKMLLRAVVGMVHRSGYRLVNLDAVIMAEAPRMAPHIDLMRSGIATACDVDIGQVSVKATTTETLGFTGRREGIAVMVTVLVERI